MKSPFAALPEREVVLVRETGDTVDGKPETVEFRLGLRPWPIGFPEFLDRVYPAPVVYTNGQPAPDKAREGEHNSLRNLVLIARCLGPQIETRAPAMDLSGRADEIRKAWHDYALAIRAEMEAAQFVDGDLMAILTEVLRVNRGAGKLPKA